MKPKLYKNALGAWVIIFPTGFTASWWDYEDARNAVKDFIADTVRLKKALHIIFYLNEAALTVRELSLIKNIRKNMKCTKKQYGYLKGIQERQLTPKQPQTT